MRVKEIEIGMTDSYKIDNYQYLKPELRVKFEVAEDEDITEAISKVEDYILERLKIFINKRLSS